MILIEDEDGAPLPDEFQPGSPLWAKAYDLCRIQGWDTITSIERTKRAMIALANILWGDDDG